MSRGLGRLQSAVLKLIEGQSEAFEKHCAEAGDDWNGGGPHFWLTWSDIRLAVYRAYHEAGGDYHDKAWLSLERSLKRALHTLVKRKLVGRDRMFCPQVMDYCYMPYEVWHEGFSPEADRKLREHMSKAT
jgi:hypothetical protein